MNQSFFEDNSSNTESVDSSDSNMIDVSALKKVEYKNKKDEIEQRWLINCLAIGISESEFWSLNPHKVKLRIEAYKQKKLEEDRSLWMQGLYNMRAFGVVLSSAFGGNMDYFKEPLMTAEKELTEEEIIEKTKELFKSLEIMQSNFERSSK